MFKIVSRPVLKHPRFVAWIVFVMVLGLWGTWAGPGWDPQPMSAVLIPETEDTAIGVREPTGKIGQYEVEKSIVEIELSDKQKIKATIRRPIGYEGLAPGMVFIHGTGTDFHSDFYREAHAISSTGIITIVSDKRTDDYSLTHRDYEKLAEDFSEVFNYLVSLDGVDPHRSGIYAVSEGCFIAPIVAVINPAVSYVALISAPVLPIREQGAWAADMYLRTLGVPSSVLRAIPRLIGQDFGKGTFEYIDFDVSTYQKQMTQPVLMSYGTGDISMPIIQGPLLVSEDLAEAGNDNLTIRYYAEADHGLQIGEGVLILVAMQDVADWVSGMPYTAHSSPHIAGAQPTQTYVADTVSRTHWFASGKIGLYIVISGLILIIASLISSAACSLIRYRQRKKAHEDEEKREVLPLARINIASIVLIVTTIALLAYIVAVAYLATNYTHNNVITYGGWTGLRILGLLSAWLSVLAFSTFFRDYKKAQSGRIPLVMASAAFLGQLILLMALAYWGVFPSLL